MRKLTISFLTVCLLVSFSPMPSAASTIAPITTHTGIPAQPVPAQPLLDRLAEIEAMDKSQLSKREKKALRKEVREIKKGLGDARSGGGVYLSLGALILVIVLLILLL